MANCTLQGSLEDIHSLVEGFRANLRNLSDEHTPEAVIRQEYVDTFWKLLGWDVSNDAHRSLAEKDVVIEATVGTLEGERIRSRRPDYIFRIDGFSRFVVEAKPTYIDIQTDKGAIFQAKTYAWNAQIPFVILMNFEQFRLFDATVKPYHSEPDRGLISDFGLRFEDYINQWDILWNTFGREAVANGSLEKLLAKIKHVQKGRRIRGIDGLLIDLRGTEPVDRVFLQHLEDFRLRFARALYRENRNNFPEANTHHGAARLTEATQRLIDRLVFIRVCEDRDITPYGELRYILNSCSKNRLDLYSELTKRFRRFDEEYNGYLFKPHFTEQLKVSPEILADFIRSLYPPEGAYRFDAIGDDLLGIIYERFLGSTITVKKNNVEAEPKPEVRHAGGVYYTPRFVVDTIIRRVVGPKIEGKTPLQILDITILDPACGSGSFLIAALQFIFDYCVRYVSEHPKAAEISASPRARKKKTKIAFKDNEGNWHLSPRFRSQLLASCLCGVDIDAQAVEVTIMSLYLKLLEGKLPKNWQREFLQSRLLPPLDNNICCGNSLLSQNDFDRYWDNKFGSLFSGDEDLRFRINAFDWNSQTRGFGRLLDKHKGFDCIIGNPPYIRVQELKKWEPEECEFYKAQYKSAAKGNYDIYVVFIERCLQLLASDGLLGFICSHKFWQAAYGKGIREILVKGKHLNSIIDFADQQVFRGVTTYTAIHIFTKQSNMANIIVSRFTKLEDGNAQCHDLDESRTTNGVCVFESAHPSNNEKWSFVKLRTHSWCEQISLDRPHLKNTADVFVGVQTSADKIYHFDLLSCKKDLVIVRSRSDGTTQELEYKLIHPLLSGPDVQSFNINKNRQIILYPYWWCGEKHGQLILPQDFITQFPLSWSYLKKHERELRSREKGRFDNDKWYQFGRSQNIDRQKGPKLCVPRLAKSIRCAFDEKGDTCLDNVDVNGIRIHTKYSDVLNPLLLTGILNSKIANTFIRASGGTHFRGGFSSFNRQFIEDVPIVIPKTSNEKKFSNRIIERVQQIINLKNKMQSDNVSEHQRTICEREIEAYEIQVNELICKLYGVDKIPD